MFVREPNYPYITRNTLPVPEEQGLSGFLGDFFGWVFRGITAMFTLGLSEIPIGGERLGKLARIEPTISMIGSGGLKVTGTTSAQEKMIFEAVGRTGTALALGQAYPVLGPMGYRAGQSLAAGADPTEALAQIVAQAPFEVATYGLSQFAPGGAVGHTLKTAGKVGTEFLQTQLTQPPPEFGMENVQPGPRPTPVELETILPGGKVPEGQKGFPVVLRPTGLSGSGSAGSYAGKPNPLLMPNARARRMRRI